ncbi:hypothetical protein BDY24DRAFT_251597 [Mrakia frigida]|uniref:uncharacterized protein n=1 Tax=Mrakia frigida TaxID=29902 RepID=UPI003FCC166F
MVKGDYRSTVAQLSKSLSGSTLEPREKERVQRGVNAVLNDMRREQRRKDLALHRTSNPTTFFLPPPAQLDELDSEDNPHPVRSSSPAGSRSTYTPSRRAPSGPPPPKSWTLAGQTRRSDSSSLPSSQDHHLLAHPLLSSFCPPYLLPTTQGPPRLLVSCLQALLPLLSTHDLSHLPRHFREGLVSLNGRRRGGMSEEGARDLLWDFRKWEVEDKSEGEDWEEEEDEEGAGEAGEGWATLDLTSTSLPHSTIKQLLLPLHTTPPTPTPITSLSLAFAASHLNLSTILPTLPGHLRVLSLAGVRLLPVGSSSSSFPTVSILRKLALATPLLQHLDLSWMSPALKPTEVALLPWTSGKECWSSLKVLGLRGMDREEEELEDDEFDARSLRMVRSAMKGRRAGWVEVFAD